MEHVLNRKILNFTDSVLTRKSLTDIRLEARTVNTSKKKSQLYFCSKLFSVFLFRSIPNV